MKTLRQYRKLIGWFMTCLMALWLPGQQAYAVDGVWNANANSNWNTPGSWVSNTVATGIGSLADFSKVNLTADRTITLTGPETIGRLILNDNNHTFPFVAASNSRYTITGSTLTFDNGGPPGLISVLGGGQHIISSNVAMVAGLNAQVDASSLVISGLISGTGPLAMNGGGTLFLQNVGNSYTGGTVVNSGTLEAQTGAAALPLTSTIFGTGDVTVTGGSLNLRYGGATSTSVVSFANNLIIGGASTISVARNAGASTGNAYSFNAFTIGNSTLTINTADSYRFEFGNTNTLNGKFATLAGNADKVFVSSVGGTGALNVTGGTVRLANAINTYSGGSNVFNGAELELAIAGAALPATGLVLVNPGARLSVQNAAQITSNVELVNQREGLAAVAINAATSGITAPLTVQGGWYDSAVLIDVGTYTSTIDLTQINGGAGVWLGAAQNATINGAGAVVANSAGNYLLGTNNAAATTLTFGAANILTGGANNVIVGDPRNRIGGITQGTGTVVINQNQNYGGFTKVNVGSVIRIDGAAAINSPLGTGQVFLPGGTLLLGNNDNSGANLANTTFTLTQRGVLELDNRGVTTGGGTTNLRLLPASTLNLSDSTFRLRASATNATTTTQNVTNINVRGSSVLDLANASTTATDNRDAVVGISGDLARQQNGVLRIIHSGTGVVLGVNAVGTNDARVLAANINGVPTATVGMVSPWIINQSAPTTPSFVGYNATNGFLNSTYTAGVLTGGTGVEIYDYTADSALSGNISAQAIRIGMVAANNPADLTGPTRLITLVPNTNPMTEGGVILRNTGNTDATHTVNWSFGDTGNKEAIFWAFTDRATNLDGRVSATNLTKAGPTLLRLRGDNRNNVPGALVANGLNGNIFINENVLSATNQFALGGSGALTTTPYVSGATLVLNGGAFKSEVNALFNTDVVNNVTAGNVGFAPGGNAPVASGIYHNNVTTSFRDLTINAAVPATSDPMLFSMPTPEGGSQLLYFRGSATLNGNSIFHTGGTFPTASGLFINGTLNGAGTLDKWGINPMYVGGDSAGYSQVINIYQGTLASANGTNAKPFGTGAITVQPGGVLRLAHPDNVAASQVTIRSDRGSLGGLALAYISPTLPTVNWNVVTGAPTDGVIAIDTVGFNQQLDMSTISPNATAIIGSTLGGVINSGPWVAGAGSTFRFGGGAGTLILNSDIATGATNFQLGVFSNSDAGASITPTNSAVQLSMARPQSFTGGIRLNGNGSQLFINYANQDFIGASATQVITSSGGVILPSSETGMRRLTPNITINNPITIDGGGLTFGDNFSSGASTYGGINLGGTITLNTGTAGLNPSFNLNQTYYRARITGSITDNGVRTDFTKSGVGVISLDSTSNSWTGNTYITGGMLAITADNNIPLNSALIVGNGGGIAVVDNNVTTNRRYQAAGGNLFFTVGSGLKLTQSATSSIFGEGALIKLGNGIMELNGTNAQNFIIASGGILQVNSPTAFSDTEGAADRIQLGGFGGLGGVLRINTTMSTNSGIVAVNSANSSNSGAIDVTAGNTFVVNGVISSGTEFDRLYKTGPGTMIMQGANTLRNLSLQEGVLRFSNNQPWSNAADVANTIRLTGGLLYQVNTGANQTVAPGGGTGRIDIGFGAGGGWVFESGSTFSTQATVTNLIRDDAGTLVIGTGGTTTLGVTGSNTARLIPTGQIFGVAVASANVNGILAPSILTASASGVADFATYVDATNGIRPYLSNGGASVTSLSGATAAQIGDISAPQTLTAALNPIYAFRTTADVSGTGRIVIRSLTNQTMGGIVFNGSNTISTPIEFEPGAGLAGGSASSGEGLVYVAGVPGGAVQNATLSGAITANRLTKSGLGNLTLTGNQMLLGAVSVQDGVLKIGSTSAINNLQTDLVVNNTGTVDLNGLTVSIDSLSSSSAATTGGGLIGTSTGNAKLIVGGASTGTFQGRIVDAVAGGSGTTTLIKAGPGTLVLGAGTAGGGGEWAPNSPDSGYNTYSGGTQLFGGTLEIRNPNALGGANGATVGAVDLYGGTLALRDHSNNYVNGGNDIRGVPESVMILGDSNTLGATFNVRGPATIDANRFQVIGNMGGQAQAQGIYQIGALNVSNNTLTLTGANSYRLRVAGTTNLTGNFANFSTSADLLNGTIQFDGQITGAAQLNKLGGGNARRILINNTTNNYSGGTNIVGGAVQVLVNSGTPLGTGPVKVLPDGALVVWGNGALGGAALSTISRGTSMGAVGLADDFNPTFLNATNFSSRFDVALQLGTINWNTPLNMAAIGDGTAFLTALASGVSSTYLAPTLGAGAVSPFVPAATGGVYRVAGGGDNLIFAGTDNVLTNNGGNPTYLQVGNPRNNAIRTTVGNGGNTVFIRNFNDFTGGTQVAFGAALQLDSGAGLTGQRPLGTGDIEVIGTFTVGGVGAVGNLSYNTASFFNANAGTNHNTIVMRPGGVINLNATAGVDVGGQGKWADAVGQDLNGGSFRYIGDEGMNSVEQVGTLTIRKDSSVVVTRQAAGSAELSIAGLTRAPGGTLLVQTGTAALLGIPDVATQNALHYERLTVSGAAPAVAGTTNNGAGATGGIVAPWMIHSQTNSFLSYTAGSGFQPVIANTATPNFGQVAYSAALTGTIASGGTGVGVVDVTGALTLNANLDHYAIRSNQNINPGTNNTITVRSGGLILNGNTINQASPNTQAMTLNFGVGGAAEALIYTGGNSVVNATINAAGLTKFGPSQLQIQSPANLTGPVYVNGGTLLAVPLRSTTGSTTTDNIFSNQTVYLNNASFRIAGRLGNATDTVANVLPTGNIATMVNIGSPIVVRGDANLDNNDEGLLQRVPSLTFDDSVADQAVARGLNSPMSLSIDGIDVVGTTTLGARSVLRVGFSGTGSTILRGQVTGGILEKWENGFLMLADGTNNFASLIVHQHQAAGASTATSTVGAMTRTGTPFGTGSIVVEPGASLRLADPSNITSNSSITVYSDDLGVGGLGIAYDGALPTFGAGAGQVNFVSTSAVSRGVIALDIGLYSQVINQSTLAAGGKHMWLGASQALGNTNSIYFAPTITGSSDGVVRLGGGGNQGNLVLGAGAFEGVLSGSGGVQLGILPATYDASAPHNVLNGNIGTVQLLNRNLGLSGDVWLNGVNGDNSGGDLALGNSFALGNAVLKINGGTIQMTAAVSPANQLDFVGQNFVVAGGNDITFRGNVNLAPGGAGGTRNFNMAGSGMAFFRGVISGADSNVIKSGAQWAVFSDANTYTGSTTINAGGLWTTANVAPGVNGPFGNSISPITIGAGILGSAGEITISRDIVVSGVGLIVGRTMQDTTITSGIAIASGQSLTVNQTTTSAGNFRGGRILLNGPISGAGALFLGDTSGTDNRSGTISFGADANGYSANNYTGGTTFRGARIQIAANTHYTGLTSAPTIISGPFGTGAINLGNQDNTAFGIGENGMTFEAVGGPRTILNTLNPIQRDADSSMHFGGVHDLTFTSALNINNQTAARNRTFDTRSSSGSVFLPGNITSSSAQGANFVKAGVGTLVLTGTNTNANTLDTSGNYGSAFFINEGVLSVSANTQLGSTSVIADISPASSPHPLAGAADVRLGGGILRVTESFATDRQFIVSAGSAIQVADTKTLTLNLPTNNATVVGTATGVRKLGGGTLVLGYDPVNISQVNIGGVFTTVGGRFGMGEGGGTVQVTTAGASTTLGDSVALRGGNLLLSGNAVAQAVTLGTGVAANTFSVGGGGRLTLVEGTGPTITSLTAGLYQREAIPGALGASQGTLTLVPTTIANLGVNERFISATGAPTPVNGMVSPHTVVRATGASQDANFVTYGANGFALHTGATVATLAGPASTSIGNIVGAPDTAGPGNIDIYALRTDSDILPTDGTTLVRIGSGGLILNGAGGPNISANLLFGTGVGNSLTEALVYVRDGQTAASTLSGNFTASNFTKFGPGNLHISGTNNVMYPIINNVGTAIRTLAIQEGSLTFAGQSSVPANALILPNDSGSFNVNGLNLTVAGLGYNGATYDGSLGTGIVTNNGGSAATLTLATQAGGRFDQTFGSVFGGVIRDGTSSLALSFVGSGTQMLATNSTYSGGTTIGTSRIVSATGVFTPLGTLRVDEYAALGTGTVTLAGGILNSRSTRAFNEVIDNIDVHRFGYGTGYNVVVAALNSFGSANTTSTLSTDATVAFQAINTLTINGPVLSTGGGATSGFLVDGATTLAGHTTLNIGQQLVLGGKINASGSTITKIGGSTLFITHSDPADGNVVGGWVIGAGALETRLADGSSNPMGAGTPITVNGATWNIRHDGDNFTGTERLTTHQTNTVTIGSTAAISSASFVPGQNAVIDARTSSGANNKTLVMGNLNFGGAIGSQYLTATGANGYSYDWNNVSLTKDGYFSTGLNNTVRGTISGGTLLKQGGGSLFVNSNTSTHGGTWIREGVVFFGAFEGANVFTASTTATLGSGHILVNPNTAIQFEAATNVTSGQRVDLVGGDMDAIPTIRLGGDFTLDAVHFRATTAGARVPLGGSNDYFLNGRNGNGVVAINAVYNTPIDMARIGDGNWVLGSTNNFNGLNGSYNAATLGIGRNATYTLGSGGAILYLGSDGVNSNILTNNGKVANVHIGTPVHWRGFDNIGGGNGRGTVVYHTGQDYTGTTLVNRSSTLEFRGNIDTSGIESWGTVIASRNGTFDGTPVTLRVGAELRFDNNIGLTPVAMTQGRWGDATALTLPQNATLRARGSNIADVTETMGQITITGQNIIAIERQVGARAMELNVAGITRGTHGIVGLTHNSQILGSDERLVSPGGAAAFGGLTNGILPAWIFSQTDGSYLTYNEFGVVNAGFNKNNGLATASSVLSTDRLFVNADNTIQAGQNITSWAMRFDGAATISPGTAASPELLIIGSGGLLKYGNNTSRINTHTVFGSVATPTEALIFVNEGSLRWGLAAAGAPTVNPQIVASRIVKTGGAVLAIEQEQIAAPASNGGALAGWTGFQGDIVINQGTVELRSLAALSTTGGNAASENNVILNGINATLGLFGRSSATTATAISGITTGNINIGTSFNNQVTIAAGVPNVIISSARQEGNTNSINYALEGGITFQGAPGIQGQTLQIAASNTNVLYTYGGVTLSGTAGSEYNNFRTNEALVVAGNVTGANAILVKTGGSSLNLWGLNALNTWSGGTILAGGTLEARATVSGGLGADGTIDRGGLGTGTITLNEGVLNMRMDGDNNATIRVYNWGNNIVVGGSSTINVARFSANGGSNKQLAINNLTIGGQTLSVTGADGYDLRINGTTTLTGNPTLTGGTDVIFNGAINGPGSSIHIAGGAYWTNTTTSNLAGGTIYVSGADLRFGAAANSTTATFGAGNPQIQINNTGRIVWVQPANVPGTGQLRSLSGGASLARVRLDATPANFTQSILQDRITTDSDGVLTLVGSSATALNMALIGNGRFFLSSTGTYSAATLGAGAGNAYRFGGEGGTITLDAAAGGVLTGANSVITGSQMANGTGTIVTNDVNDYSGNTVVTRGSALHFTAANTATPAGGLGNNTGTVHVFGELRATGGVGTFINSTGTANLYAPVLHPGSILRLQDATATVDRWHNTTPIGLNGSQLLIQTANTAALLAAETVGDINFDRGSRIQLSTQNTARMTLTTSSLARTSSTATLVFQNSAANRLGATPGTNTEHVIVSGTAPANVTGKSIMPGYYIAGSDNTFVTYSGTPGVGITRAAFTHNFNASPFFVDAATLNNASVVDVSTTGNVNAVLSGDVTLFALRQGNNDLSSGAGQQNTITFAGSGSDVGGYIFSGGNDRTSTPNLKFGDVGTADAYLYVGANALFHRGDITAGKVIKFGNGQWVIAKDQSDAARGPGNGYSNGWVVNEGQLQAATFGSLGNAVGTNTVILNGNTSNGQAQAATLFLRAQTGNPLESIYTSGKITMLDRATIDWDSGAGDRTSTIAAIDLVSTNTSGIAEGDGRFTFNFASNRARNYLKTGEMTLTGNSIVEIASVTAGGVSGVMAANLAGTGNLTKWGSGYLYVLGANNSYSGNITIDQGALAAAHTDALGSGTVTVNRHGVLDVLVAGLTKTATYNTGSVERWSVNGARTGTLNLGAGTLQVNADQTQTVAVTMTGGGGIEGFLTTQDNVDGNTGGVFRTLGANVTFNISGTNYLGQRYQEGSNGLDSGVQPRIFEPYNNAGRGVMLEIKGQITGSGSIIKTGHDTVTISAANNYTGATDVQNGTLRLGIDNATPTATTLTTRGDAIVDLNGFNTTVGQLTSPAATHGGYITNTATVERTLTTNTATNSTYGGVIQNNVALTKAGTSTLTLTSENTYIGKTTISGGTLALTNNGTTNANIVDSRWVEVGSGAILDTTGRTLSGANGGLTYDGRLTGGGTDAAGTTYATVTNAARINTGAGGLVIGDHQGAYCLTGTLAPGAASLPLDITTAGNQIGHVYTSSNLTINGQLAGTVSTTVDRLSMQLNGATTTLTALGYTGVGPTESFIDGLLGTEGELNGTAGTLTGHDYVNVGGALAFNQYGKVVVSNFGTFNPGFGMVFNLLDWSSVNFNSFATGARYQTGTENNDLDLPTLSDAGWSWDTSRFQSHGVVIVVPEPSRALLILLGLLGLMMRRRRQAL